MAKRSDVTLLEEYIARTGHKPTRAVAVRLQCVECMGGERAEARRCATRTCLLWPFGLAALAEKRAAKGLAAEVDDDALVDGAGEPPEEDGPEDDEEGLDGAAGPPAPAAPAEPAPPPARRTPPAAGKRCQLPPIGTVLERKDASGMVMATARVTGAGLEYNGKIYASMNACALAATRDLGKAVVAVNGWAWWGAAR